MDYQALLNDIKQRGGFELVSTSQNGSDEIYLDATANDFKKLCLFLHKTLSSPAMMFFCSENSGAFRLRCVFEDAANKRWVFAETNVSKENSGYETLSREMHSAALFEREIYESFGVKALGNPDMRRLNLHDETWPEGNYPLRKDFNAANIKDCPKQDYAFRKIEGEGIFEVPVGPVHAGIIGPGHFRFSAAGEPIINLEIRLGFTHKGVEKLFEGKYPAECIGLAERVSGDSSYAHGLSFCHASEKIFCVEVPAPAARARCVFLELERMYNHISDMGGIALDVGFTFASAYASVIKEKLLAFNEQLTASRYLKGINLIGGVLKGIGETEKKSVALFLEEILKDYVQLRDILLSSVSFMDRVDGTGKLGTIIAQDLGVVGLCARASGIDRDLRKDFPGLYDENCFVKTTQTSGDVLARLKIRMCEFEESINIIGHMLEFPLEGGLNAKTAAVKMKGSALGYKEGWRGPVLYWFETNESGLISRCKIVDPSFHNWQGLSYAVRKNIIPDFPLCNKSFNLSYSGNDL
jgi:Ni,Fe-hydrogenase III large subunit/Ni,Fe-hydrogenase III component G